MTSNHNWPSDGELPSIEECQSTLREKKHDAYISMKKSLHDQMCSHTYSGLIGVDFAKRSDNVKYAMMFKPETRAEETINWFLYGKKYGSPPKHFNCRCQAVDLKHISTEG